MDATANRAFAYFATGKFHRKMRALNKRMEREGRMPADIGHFLGCSTADFFAYLHEIKDESGMAYVDVGGGASIKIDLGAAQTERLRPLVAPEHLAEAVDLHLKLDAAVAALPKAKSKEDALLLVAGLRDVGDHLAELITGAPTGEARHGSTRTH